MQENSGSQRRCIGVYVAKPDRDYQSGLLRGIYKAAFEHDMNVAVFGATLAGGVASENEPELDIFTLPNFDRLSGIIYISASFDYKHTDEVITEPLVKAVREKRIYAVTIDRDIDDVPMIVFDDTETVRGLIEHVIKCHGCRDIAFMTGTRSNIYSEERLKLFKSIINENGLEVLPDRTYYGDFWYNEGENFVNILEKSENGLPDAIICANNHMARSVYRALQKKGYSMPGDVILACYTDEPNSFRYITAASKQADYEGYMACQRLISMIDGKDSGVHEPIKSRWSLNASITCGCLPAEKYDHSAMEGIDVNAPQSYFSEFNYMTSDLLGRPGFREMFWSLDWYTTYIPGIRGIHFCLCEGWESPCDERELEQSLEEAVNISSERVRGYTKRMQPYFSRVNHSDGTHDTVFDCSDLFPVECMFPKLFEPSGEPSAYIFRTLRFREKNFGYIVIDTGGKMQTYDIAFDYWLRDVSNVMEYQRKLGNEKYLYSSDFMTGLINRNGFNRMMPGIINEAHRGGFQLLVAVCDLNGLKYINDTFGHIEGDNSIKIAANAVLSADFPALTVDKTFRIGGDEYVKAVIGHFTEEDVELFKKRIYDALDEYNKTSRKPYPVYISIGVVVKNPDEDYTPDSLISEADKLMFADKLRIKKMTGFDPKRNM